MGRFPSVGSSESSCSSEKHLTSREADVDRVWDEGEGTRGGGGDSPRKRPRLASIGVKNCRSRLHLWCAGLKARSTPADSQDC